MKVTLSAIGKFHHFDLARELDRRGALTAVLTGYPRWKLKDEGIAPAKIKTFPWIHAPYMALGRLKVKSATLAVALEKAGRLAHDRWAATALPQCDAFVGLSGHNLRAGRRARKLGAKWICDRGSTHIIFQNNILEAEHARWGIPWKGISRSVIEQEILEYNEADVITVPSAFNMRTFVAAGVPTARLRQVPYGVNLEKFYPMGEPVPGRFDLLYVGGMSVRKGIPYLLDAFRQLNHPKKRLTLIGGLDPTFSSWFYRNLSQEGVEYLGPLAQSRLPAFFSRSHAFVIASVEEGLALVQAQALACGCPVICTKNTGGEDLFSDGVEGRIVPAGDSTALASSMQQLADSPELAMQMRGAAYQRVKLLGGWSTYGNKYIDMLMEITTKD